MLLFGDLQVYKTGQSKEINFQIDYECLNTESGTCSILSKADGSAFAKTGLNDKQVGGILLALSILLIIALMLGVIKLVNQLLKGTISRKILKLLEPEFNNKWFEYGFGYILILIGMGITMLIQSSSIFTATLIPLAGTNALKLETIYPLFLGSNLGTTFTSLVAATATANKENEYEETKQIFYVHFFFNLLGILMFYTIPFLR